MNIRLFVAITPPRALLGHIDVLQTEARETFGSPSIRWQSPEKLHMTLQFLGGVPAHLVPELTSRLQRIPPRAPITLSPAPPGAFPSLRRPRVLWLGVAGDLATLGGLQADIAEATSGIVAAGDSRPFTPHLTLARIAAPLDVSALRALREWAGSACPPPSSWTVDEFELWQSLLGPGGSQYTRLRSFPLKGAP